mgnify:CR=1 FL=1
MSIANLVALSGIRRKYKNHPVATEHRWAYNSYRFVGGYSSLRTRNNPTLYRAPPWVNGFTAWLPERLAGVHSAGFTLLDLARRGLLSAETIDAFKDETGLADFAWRVYWSDGHAHSSTQAMADRLRLARGLVIFLHGWTGTGAIWEDLPAQVVARNPQTVALVPDVNGFGGTPFRSSLPLLEQCGPPALMHTVERWLDLIKVRPEPRRGRRPLVYVGHSMSGAALFFLDECTLEQGDVGCIAAAPALLMNDRDRQRFYKTLGAGIRLTGLTGAFDRLAEAVIAPRVIEALAGGASDLVQAEHRRVYRATPQGVVARTFAALAELDADLSRESWPHFSVFLGEDDRLVGLEQALSLLETFHFRREQIHAMPGDHYFFSIGARSPDHAHNRERLLAEIIDMMDRLQKSLSMNGRDPRHT